MAKTLPKPSPGLLALAEEYFSLLARSLPVCCLSDEFHFMPRVETARLSLDRADCLERGFLEGLCAQVRAWRARLERLGEAEDPGLAGLLRRSMDAFRVHWESLALWKRDPGLYLKVAFIGLDQALSRPPGDGGERWGLYLARLEAVPRLLSWGIDQLEDVPQPAREAALDMAHSARAFLARVGQERTRGPELSGKELGKWEQRASEALGRFQDFLRGLRGPEGPCLGTGMFEEVLGRGYGWRGGVGEALAILGREVLEKERELAQLAREIRPDGEWRSIYNRIRLPEKAYREPLSLYREEVQRLDTFFRGRNLLPMPPKGSVRVEPTPSYLEPIRATASYSAPPSPEDRVSAAGRFFVQVFGAEASSEEGRRRLDSAHREYRYLAAHETCPGHHLLDWARLGQQDPIRRRVESALFYEGWACYAEQLVDELGYRPDPAQRLIRIKRDLWRAVRGELDAGLHVGAVSLEQGAERLEGLGYEPRDAAKQVRRITLTPGYQLCYTLGKRGFLDLRHRHVPPLSLGDFHARVLGAGQVPFDCLDRALADSASGEG